jgi:predicted Rossmann fold nucleotide-binding protein DprA/Smf involved in DNA uptake
MERPTQERELTAQDIMALGCDQAFAQRVISLLSRQEQLDWYLEKAKAAGCRPLSRISADYPGRLHTTLGLDAPACLWVKGDTDILKRPRISLVGSRDLHPKNREFAQLVGVQAAKQGYVLVSGNARGADREAQESCLRHGGFVICVLADPLTEHEPKERVLYVAEEGFDIAFSSYRALSRNRIIHALSEKTFVAQCSLKKGGTWSGTEKNLRHGWSEVYCYCDGSDAVAELQAMGANPVTADHPEMLFAQQPSQMKMM